MSRVLIGRGSWWVKSNLRQLVRFGINLTEIKESVSVKELF